jgi:HEAT repeat protein
MEEVNDSGEHRARMDIGLEELHEALTSTDPVVRAEAALRARPDPGVEQALIATLSDHHPHVRQAAVAALARFGGPRVIRALIRVSSTDPSPIVREESVDALGRMLNVHPPEDEASRFDNPAGGTTVA